MVWLNVADVNGNGLYLNIFRVEQRAGGNFDLHAMIGDGFYEGQILVEVAEPVKITFADQWLDRRALEEFFFRVDRASVEDSIAATASEMLFCVENFPSSQSRPRREVVGFRSEGRHYTVHPLKEEQLELPMIGEGEIRWQAA